jgi:hypothetical protein
MERRDIVSFTSKDTDTYHSRLVDYPWVGLYPGKIHGGLRCSYSLLRMRLDMSIPGVMGRMI